MAVEVDVPDVLELEDDVPVPEYSRFSVSLPATPSGVRSLAVWKATTAA